MLKSYFNQLQELAADVDVPLLKIFVRAGVPPSTYYRTVQGKTAISYDTAVKVANMIQLIKEGRTRSRKNKRQL